jgi:hypothetical protein
MAGRSDRAAQKSVWTGNRRGLTEQLGKARWRVGSRPPYKTVPRRALAVVDAIPISLPWGGGGLKPNEQILCGEQPE